MTKPISSQASVNMHQNEITDLDFNTHESSLEATVNAIKDRIFFEVQRSVQQSKSVEIAGLNSILALKIHYNPRKEMVKSHDRVSILTCPLFEYAIKTDEEKQIIASLIQSAPVHNELTFIHIFSIKILDEIEKHQEALPREIKGEFLDVIDNLLSIYTECLYLSPAMAPPFDILNVPMYFRVNHAKVLAAIIEPFEKKYESYLDRSHQLLELKSHLHILLKMLKITDCGFGLCAIELALFSECTEAIESAHELIPACHLAKERLENFTKKQPTQVELTTLINLKPLQGKLCDLIALLKKIPLHSTNLETSKKNNKNICDTCIAILRDTAKHALVLTEKHGCQEINNIEFARHQNQLKQIDFIIDKILLNIPKDDSIDIKSICLRSQLLATLIAFSKTDTSYTKISRKHTDKKNLEHIINKIDSLSSVTVLKKGHQFDAISYKLGEIFLHKYKSIDIKYSFERVTLSIEAPDTSSAMLQKDEYKHLAIPSKNITNKEQYPFPLFYSIFFNNFDLKKYSADFKRINDELTDLVKQLPHESLTKYLENKIRHAIYATCQKHLLQCILYADMNLLLKNQETSLENLFPDSLLDLLFFKLPNQEDDSESSDDSISSREDSAAVDKQTAFVTQELQQDLHEKVKTLSFASSSHIEDRQEILAAEAEVATKSKSHAKAAEAKTEETLQTTSEIAEMITQETKTRKIIKLLLKMGFSKETGKGSHQHLRSPEGKLIVIPLHDELKEGTKKSIANSFKS